MKNLKVRIVLYLTLMMLTVETHRSEDQDVLSAHVCSARGLSEIPSVQPDPSRPTNTYSPYFCAHALENEKNPRPLPVVLALQWGPFGRFQGIIDDFANLEDSHDVVWKQIDEFNNMTTAEYEEYSAIVIPDATIAALPSANDCKSGNEILVALSANGKSSNEFDPHLV